MVIIKFSENIFCLERRNLALAQPGVANGEEVDSLLINEDNPPDGNYLFGEEVGCFLVYHPHNEGFYT